MVDCIKLKHQPSNDDDEPMFWISKERRAYRAMMKNARPYIDAALNGEPVVGEHLGPCTVGCGRPARDRHHVSYIPERVVYVCRECHYTITAMHRTKSTKELGASYSHQSVENALFRAWILTIELQAQHPGESITTTRDIEDGGSAWRDRDSESTMSVRRCRRSGSRPPMR